MPCQDGDIKIQGVTRHVDFFRCAVFFLALRVFCMLVFNVETNQPVATHLDMSDPATWLRLPLFPLSQDAERRRGARRREQDTYGAAVKTALRDGAAVPAHRLSGLNLATEVRSKAAKEMLDGGMAINKVSLRSPACVHRTLNTGMPDCF